MPVCRIVRVSDSPLNQRQSSLPHDSYNTARWVFSRPKAQRIVITAPLRQVCLVVFHGRHRTDDLPLLARTSRTFYRVALPVLLWISCVHASILFLNAER